MSEPKKITKLPLSEDVFLALRLYDADVEASVMLRDRVAALERALKYRQDDKEVMQNIIDVHEVRLSKMEGLEEQLRDIPGVDLQAKISVLRLWAEPGMERRAEEEA